MPAPKIHDDQDINLINFEDDPEPTSSPIIQQTYETYVPESIISSVRRQRSNSPVFQQKVLNENLSDDVYMLKLHTHKVSQTKHIEADFVGEDKNMKQNSPTYQSYASTCYQDNVNPAYQESTNTSHQGTLSVTVPPLLATNEISSVRKPSSLGQKNLKPNKASPVMTTKQIHMPGKLDTMSSYDYAISNSALQSSTYADSTKHKPRLAAALDGRVKSQQVPQPSPSSTLPRHSTLERNTHVNDVSYKHLNKTDNDTLANKMGASVSKVDSFNGSSNTNLHKANSLTSQQPTQPVSTKSSSNVQQPSANIIQPPSASNFHRTQAQRNFRKNNLKLDKTGSPRMVDVGNNIKTQFTPQIISCSESDEDQTESEDEHASKKRSVTVKQAQHSPVI